MIVMVFVLGSYDSNGLCSGKNAIPQCCVTGLIVNYYYFVTILVVVLLLLLEISIILSGVRVIVMVFVLGSCDRNGLCSDKSAIPQYCITGVIVNYYYFVTTQDKRQCY